LMLFRQLLGEREDRCLLELHVGSHGRL
jgi:hypothetical protein